MPSSHLPAVRTRSKTLRAQLLSIPSECSQSDMCLRTMSNFPLTCPLLSSLPCFLCLITSWLWDSGQPCQLSELSLLHLLNQWFSKCSPQTNSISITWELVRNANSQTPARPTESETPVWDLVVWVLRSPQVIRMHIQVKELLFSNIVMKRSLTNVLVWYHLVASILPQMSKALRLPLLTSLKHGQFLRRLSLFVPSVLNALPSGFFTSLRWRHYIKEGPPNTLYPSTLCVSFTTLLTIYYHFICIF